MKPALNIAFASIINWQLGLYNSIIPRRLLMFTIVSGSAKASQSTIQMSRGFGLEYQDLYDLKTNCFTVAHACTAIVIINHYLH